MNFCFCTNNKNQECLFNEGEIFTFVNSAGIVFSIIFSARLKVFWLNIIYGSVKASSAAFENSSFNSSTTLVSVSSKC